MMQLDSFGTFLDDSLTVKVGEIQFPSSNINIYQEDNTPDGSQDLIEYAELWGGPQNRPLVDKTKPNSTEQDPSMLLQGERPETYLNAAPPEDAPVTQMDAPATLERRPSGDAVNQNDPLGDRNAVPPPIGEPNDYYGPEDNTDRVYVYASKGKGDSMSKPSKKLVDMTVKAAFDKGFAFGANTPHKVKVACLEDLYAFDRSAGSNSLVHKSSKELWTIQADGDGFMIEKQFKDGEPVRV